MIKRYTNRWKNINAAQGELDNLNSANDNAQKQLNSEKNTNDGNDNYSSGGSSNQLISNIEI